MHRRPRSFQDADINLVRSQNVATLQRRQSDSALLVPSGPARTVPPEELRQQSLPRPENPVASKAATSSSPRARDRLRAQSLKNTNTSRDQQQAEESEGQMPAPPLPPLSPPQYWAQALTEERNQRAIKQQLRTLRVIHKVLKVRSQLEFEQKKLEASRRFAQESMSDFMQAKNEFMLDPTSESKSRALDQTYKRCVEDSAQLAAQEALIAPPQTTLSNLEFELMGEERASVDLLKSLFTSLGMPFATPDLTESSIVESEPGPSETPSLLLRYYESRGEIDIQKERLQDLDESHREELEYRDLRVDQGEENAIPDTAFAQDYEHQRQTIQAELRQAEIDTEHFAEMCRAANLTIEDAPELLFEDFGSALDSHPSMPEPDFSELLSPPNLQTLHHRSDSPTIVASTGRLDSTESFTSRRPRGVPDVSRSVQNWLGNLAPPLPPGTPGSAQEYVSAYTHMPESRPESESRSPRRGKSLTRRHSHPLSRSPSNVNRHPERSWAEFLSAPAPEISITSPTGQADDG